MALALLGGKDVRHAELAARFLGSAHNASVIRRVERFFDRHPIQPSDVARVVLTLLPSAQPREFIFNRTNWKYGQTDVNVLRARATVNVGPGPFVPELVLPSGAKAGRPLDLHVAFCNVWRSAVSGDLRLCGQGLLIRDEEGQTVYDNQPEKTTCTSDLRLTTVASGGVHVERWGPLPALKAGRYTAVLWGTGAVKRFEMRP